MLLNLFAGFIIVQENRSYYFYISFVNILTEKIENNPRFANLGNSLIKIVFIRSTSLIIKRGVLFENIPIIGSFLYSLYTLVRNCEIDSFPNITVFILPNPSTGFGPGIPRLFQKLLFIVK